jgi:hypothetical protein
MKLGEGKPKMQSTALRANRPARSLTEDLYDWEWEPVEASSAALTQHNKQYVIPFRGGSSQLVVVTPKLPNWLEPTIEGFSTVLSLRENWDSYGGKRTSADSIKQALAVLTQIMEVNSPVPSVVPLGSGGLQLEWHRKQQDLEIVFELDAAPIFYYQNRASGKALEGFATDSNSLASVFANLA